MLFCTFSPSCCEADGGGAVLVAGSGEGRGGPSVGAPACSTPGLGAQRAHLSRALLRILMASLCSCSVCSWIFLSQNVFITPASMATLPGCFRVWLLLIFWKRENWQDLVPCAAQHREPVDNSCGAGSAPHTGMFPRVSGSSLTPLGSSAAPHGILALQGSSGRFCNAIS